MANAGIVALIDCTLVANSSGGGFGGTGGFGCGGGLLNAGTATVSRCTINGNRTGASGFASSAAGGGIHNSGTLSLLTSTIFDNFANAHYGFGGGITHWGMGCTMRNSTIASNTAGLSGYGGGLSTSPFGAYNTDIGGTIFTGNMAHSGPGGPGPMPDCYGVIVSSDYNLIQDTNGCVITGSKTHNIYNQNPLLGPLQDNGGPTFTTALLPNSPAIDKGRSFGLATDQRGRVRPWDPGSIANAAGGDGSDIGAFEVAPENPRLQIQRVRDNVVLSWPTNDTNFRLQSTTNLIAAGDWRSLSGTPALVANRLYVTNIPSLPKTFYRLMAP